MHLQGHETSSSIQPSQAVAAAAAAAVLLLSPLSAHAVSGGGGISTPLSGQDLSGQDLTKRSFTKAVLRKTNFAGANLRGKQGRALLLKTVLEILQGSASLFSQATGEQHSSKARDKPNHQPVCL